MRRYKYLTIIYQTFKLFCVSFLVKTTLQLYTAIILIFKNFPWWGGPVISRLIFSSTLCPPRKDKSKTEEYFFDNLRAPLHQFSNAPNQTRSYKKNSNSRAKIDWKLCIKIKSAARIHAASSSGAKRPRLHSRLSTPGRATATASREHLEFSEFWEKDSSPSLTRTSSRDSGAIFGISKNPSKLFLYTPRAMTPESFIQIGWPLPMECHNKIKTAYGKKHTIKWSLDINKIFLLRKDWMEEARKNFGALQGGKFLWWAAHFC
jgi:hypothetical protein